MMLREGMFLADRYEIIEQIGTGGMAACDGRFLG